MDYGKRLFLTSTVTYPVVISVACGSGDSSQSPTAPSQPAPPPTSPNPQQTCWGVRIGEEKFAGSPGNLLQVMDAAKLTYQLKNGLVVSFAGVTPQLGIIFLVRGEYFRAPAQNIPWLEATAGLHISFWVFTRTVKGAARKSSPFL
jgi:hypothetical protein